MNKKKISAMLAAVLATSTILTGCGLSDVSTTEEKTYTIETKSDGKTEFNIITNPNGGETLSYSTSSGIELLEVKDGDITYAFKDMDKDGELDDWEDWRLDIERRAEDLASKMSKEQIAGLMLFSSHERNIEDGLTEDQKTYLQDDNLRNILNAGSNNTEAAALWSNEMQSYVESLGEEGVPIIPVNFSSDPRSTAGSGDQYMVDGTDISLWPSNLGLAATFNPDTVFEFAKISSKEYRGMGITTALGPQIDLATEPRWLRVDGTFGENTKLTTDMTEAYVNGAQSSYDENGNDLGWSSDSISVMIKHFPGDGAGESGRESHMKGGKYAVYPGDNFNEHTIPFMEGGLDLSGKTKTVSSVMSSYSIGINKDGEAIMGNKMGSAYNSEKIDILRKDNDYDGVICTDWGVTKSLTDENSTARIGTAWGAENLSEAERHYEILKSGVDMFGGNNDKTPVLEAYDLWQKDYEAGNIDISADERFAESGKRLTKMIMETNLFENPYLDVEESKKIVGSSEKVEAGYQAQLDSVVMVKNSNDTIKKADVTSDYKDKVVYIPSTIYHGFDSIFGEGETTANATMNLDVAKLYFKDVVTDEPILNDAGETIGFTAPDLSEVDMAIVGMSSPDNGSNFTSPGLSEDGYYPLSLQYRPYTANGENVRKESIAGDILEDGSKENRSYYGKTSIIANEYDLDACLNTIDAVKKAEEETGKEIPIVVAMKAKNPVIMSEFESEVDAIVVGFSISDRALFDVILGKQEPNGLLPVQFPKDMNTVEGQYEDVAHDMEVYVDSEGNSYDFAYGLNYNRVIKDKRTEKYSVK